MKRRHACRLRKGIARFKLIVLEKFEGGAMNLIRSRLCLDLDDRAASLRKFCVKIACRSREFLHGIDGRINHYNPQDWIGIVHTIGHEIGPAKELPVRSNLDSPLRVLSLTVLPRVFCSPREQQL